MKTILTKILNIFKKNKTDNVKIGVKFNTTPTLNSFNIPTDIECKDKTQTLILIHKINVIGMSRSMGAETINEYIEYNVKPLDKADIKIHNIIIPIRDADTNPQSGVEAIYPSMVDVYPTIKYLIDEFDGKQTTTQERRLKIDSVLKS